MTTFRGLAPASVAPGRVVTVPVEAFAPTWDERPKAPVQIGLRLLSEQDVRESHLKSLAHARRMSEDPRDHDGAYADHLVRLAVARAATMPGDARMAYFGMMAEDLVPVAMTPEGMLFLYEELLVYTNEQSPLVGEATDDEVFDALERLQDAEPHVQQRLRRILGYVVRALDEAGV